MPGSLKETQKERTYHIHMVKSDSELWIRLLFRDYLKEFPAEARRYDTLKKSLANRYTHDRVEYTQQKSVYIQKITEKAKEYYKKKEIELLDALEVNLFYYYICNSFVAR